MALLLIVWLVVVLVLSVAASSTSRRFRCPCWVASSPSHPCALTLSASWRQRALALGYRPLIAIHLTRFVGLDFLWLYSLGVLPRNFAVPAGWGDIIVAILAIALLIVDSSSSRWRGALFFWNLIGLADILMVVVMAFQMAMADPASRTHSRRCPSACCPPTLSPW